MIISRTPFRVSFAGGGSDLREFYSQHGHGAVVSTAIQQYMYVVIHPYFHDKIRIKYSKTEDVENVEDIKHPLVRECLKKVGIDKGIEIASFADIASGTGLGSSSAFTVGLLNALYAYNGKIISKADLAEQACEIEIDILKEPIGKQDQYAAAFGNINIIRFNRDESVNVIPVLLTENNKAKIEKTILLYYVGGQRRACDILREQQKNIISNNEKFEYLKGMFNQVEKCKDLIVDGQIKPLGALLHHGWKSKKKLASNISNSMIDQLYSDAKMHGSMGGKLLGAGGAGFLLLVHDDHDKLSQKMSCMTLPLKIDQEGSKIIFYE
ncbi:D-glycero-alpha-D-manno-heptose-7-phosphate kinase [Desulfobacula phenolica]|uniref:D-glycero-alpha-D-manno-heptose-7-phosphate kinase n=1 Tax=Desulfobacula phenolica TaxID=90732 RepID=A0A1H2DRT9_9BACT|nr:D-glycero-alpha-D-manno-heptose-7-phosphate kinase [Desulfobacula phenolica]